MGLVAYVMTHVGHLDKANSRMLSVGFYTACATVNPFAWACVGDVVRVGAIDFAK